MAISLPTQPRPNDPQAVADVVPKGVQVVAAIESCCGAAAFAEKLIEQPGWSVHLAHAGYVSRMKQSPDKSDFTDARLLADLVRVGYLPKVWLAPIQTRELRRMVRLRQQIVNYRKKEKLRCSAILRDLRVKCPGANRTWSKPWREWIADVELPEASRYVMDIHLMKIAAYNEQLKQVEKRLQDMITDDALSQWLLDQTGIGIVTAVTMRAEIGRFDRFRNGKQLSRFCGVTPCGSVPLVVES
jgi:transposase